MKCRNCDIEITSKFCPNCGQPNELQRIDRHYITHEIAHLLHFEKGVLYTIKQLFTNPGNTVRKFITEDRSRLVKPVIFVIVTSLIFSFIAHFFHIEGLISYTGNQESTADKIFKWGNTYSGYANLIIGVFVALWTKLLFRKFNFNLFEILILVCFVTGMSMIIFSVFAIFQGLTHLKLMEIAGIVGILYSTWSIGDFFNKKKISSYIKSFFAYVLGVMTFSITIVLIGALIDNLIGH